MNERRRKEIASLTHRKYRERLGQVCVEGLRAVASAVVAGAPLMDIVVTPEARAQPRVQVLLAQTTAPVTEMKASDLARISEVQASQGILAVAQAVLVPPETLHTLQTLVVLDGVQDPGNVGTVLRTAAWFGAEAVLAGPGTADFFNPKVVRASMGGLWDVRLAQTPNLPAFLTDLRAAGWALYGADLEGQDARTWTPRRPSALLLGSEAHGLHPEVHALLHARIAVAGTPTRRGAESLNVAVAGGILLYQWLGQ